PSDDGTAPDIRAAIMFVGDSNIAFALTSVATELTQVDEPYMIIDVARAGVTIRSPDDFWRVRLRQALKRINPDGVVINLGINDTGTPGTATGPGYASYGAKIDWLMQLFPDKTPVWWTNLP